MASKFEERPFEETWHKNESEARKAIGGCWLWDQDGETAKGNKKFTISVFHRPMLKGADGKPVPHAKYRAVECQGRYGAYMIVAKDPIGEDKENDVKAEPLPARLTSLDDVLKELAA